MLFRPKPKDADPKERALWGDLMSLGMVVPAAIVLGYFIGRWAAPWWSSATTTGTA